MMSSRGPVLFACFTALVMLLLSPVTCKLAKINHFCNPSSCGNIQNISYPFRLKEDPQHCGHHNYELSCENNRTILQMIDSGGRYYVEEINYTDLSMRVVDVGLQKDNCSSLPLYSLPSNDFSNYRNPYYLGDYYKNTGITFMSCATPVMNSTRYIVTTAVCNNENTTSLNSSSSSSPLLLFQRHRHTYVVYGRMSVTDVEDSCRIEIQSLVIWDPNEEIHNISFLSIHDKLVYGFLLSWYEFSEVSHSDIDKENSFKLWEICFPSSRWCLIQMKKYSEVSHSDIDKENSFKHWEICFPSSRWCLIQLSVKGYNKKDYSYHIQLGKIIPIYIGSCGFLAGSIYASCLILLFVVARTLCGSPCVFAFLVYKWRRRHSSMYDSIEEFIQSHNKLMPVRYSYSDIKKMTKGFKDKLGEGGYGSVFKGKLRSGHLVAVKILSNSKANGQDFMNEVATIGRIHHVNVARLIGFCAERSKRALVYDFMPNGSLEKYIFPREEGIIFLSFEKLYVISLGIARGIEYLHGGCDMQILHFDIKPHNILLDEKFTPKVSDFGLAKLYPTDDSIVNLTAARGTMGYMAPELFYKNIGGVSYKADVYSFGMLLMEMASKRKNLNPFVEHLSQIYFPSWIYDQFSDGKDRVMGDATEEERKIAKKMIIVAFWCIQLKPTDRPSMSKVVEMLEGNVELQMPPKPSLSPQEIPAEDHGININPTALSISSGDSTDSISLIANAI